MKKNFRRPETLIGKESFQQTLSTQLKANGLTWRCPQTEIDEVVALCFDYHEKAMAIANPSMQCPSLTAARNAAWRDVWKASENIYQRYLLYNDAISVEEQEILGIYKVNFGSRTPPPAPTTAPLVRVEVNNIARLTLRYSSEEPPFRRKPANVIFCQVAMKVGGEEPKFVAECVSTYNFSKQRYPIDFELKYRGQMVYMFARWVNRKGMTGPWSGMITAIIP